MNYRQPHGVLLFFERGRKWDRDGLAAQREYYNALQGKTLQYSLPAHGAVVFISLQISSDEDLAIILENDPALREEILEIFQATPLKNT